MDNILIVSLLSAWTVFGFMFLLFVSMKTDFDKVSTKKTFCFLAICGPLGWIVMGAMILISLFSKPIKSMSKWLKE